MATFWNSVYLRLEAGQVEGKTDQSVMDIYNSRKSKIEARPPPLSYQASANSNHCCLEGIEEFVETARAAARTLKNRRSGLISLARHKLNLVCLTLPS